MKRELNRIEIQNEISQNIHSIHIKSQMWVAHVIYARCAPYNMVMTEWREERMNEMKRQKKRFGRIEYDDIHIFIVNKRNHEIELKKLKRKIEGEHQESTITQQWKQQTSHTQLQLHIWRRCKLFVAQSTAENINSKRIDERINANLPSVIVTRA